MKPNDVVKGLTTKLIDLMKKGGKWTKPWANKRFISVDGHNYTGINCMWLAFAKYDRKVWGTYKQWAKHECQVSKGEKSTKLLFFKKYFKEQDKGRVEVNGKVGNIYRYLRMFDVFNIEQVEGNTSRFDKFDVFENKVNDVSHAENFTTNTKAKIQSGDRAYYVPSMDYICMPDKDAFINTEHSTATENYYTTLFHEMTHWTGHKDRCNRELSTRFGSKDYAFEELVAELGSCFIATHLNITSSPREDHAQYLNSWIKCLEENDDAIWKASSLANKAFEHCKELQPQTNAIKEVA